MIQVNDIILATRSRLRDTTTKELKWSDEELIDMINSSLTDIAKELNPFTHKENIYIKENEDKYRLPHNVLRVLSVNTNDKPITIKSLEWLEKNKDRVCELCVCFDEQSFFLYPIEKVSIGQKIKVTYKFIEQVQLKTDFIKIPILAKKAILYHTMHLAYQINTSEKNSAKSTHYLNLYDKEIASIKPIFFSNRHSKKITSPFRKI